MWTVAVKTYFEQVRQHLDSERDRGFRAVYLNEELDKFERRAKQLSAGLPCAGPMQTLFEVQTTTTILKDILDRLRVRIRADIAAAERVLGTAWQPPQANDNRRMSA